MDRGWTFWGTYGTGSRKKPHPWGVCHSAGDGAPDGGGKARPGGHTGKRFGVSHTHTHTTPQPPGKAHPRTQGNSKQAKAKAAGVNECPHTSREHQVGPDRTSFFTSESDSNLPLHGEQQPRFPGLQEGKTSTSTPLTAEILFPKLPTPLCSPCPRRGSGVSPFLV